MPRGEIFFVLNHLYIDFTSVYKHAIPPNVIILSMTSSYYKYFLKLVMGDILIFFPTHLYLTNTFQRLGTLCMHEGGNVTRICPAYCCII